MIWRIEMQARVQGKVQLKDSICFKWVHIGSKNWDPKPPLPPSKVGLTKPTSKSTC